MKLKYTDDTNRLAPNYIEHLARYKYLQNTRVFKTFGTGVFHDGVIENLKFIPEKGELSFLISCPNFEISDENLFLSVDFEISFKGVKYFQYLSGEENLSKDSRNESLTFLSAEFNTLGILSEILKENYNDNNWYDDSEGGCEILLNCIDQDEILLGFSFREFDLSPVNNSLFYMVCKESGFDYNYFQLADN